MAADETISLLRRTPILGLLEDGALRVIASVADPRRLEPGESLFRQGDRSDGGYVVMSGSIAVGHEGDAAEAAVLEAGALLGQAALFVRMQRPATAMAREASGLMRVSPTLMRRVLQEFPTSVPAIRDALARDLQGLSDELGRVAEMMASVGALRTA